MNEGKGWGRGKARDEGYAALSAMGFGLMIGP
jgi:hypothetical protein